MNVSGANIDQVIQLVQSYALRDSTEAQISAAVLRQILHTQQMQAEAVAAMIQSASLDGVGSLVNIQI